MFGPLLGMMRNVNYTEPFTPDWLPFVMKCADFANCSVVDFCGKYPFNFKCDAEGHLRQILLNGHLRIRLIGQLDLSMIPHYVSRLALEANNLTSIGKWKDLAIIKK